MLAERYDFGRFVRRVTGKGYLEVIQAAIAELYTVERKLRGAWWKKAREQGADDYAAKVRGLLFFMDHGVTPDGVDETTFQLFRPICEDLVQQGHFEPESLAVFDRSRS